MGDINKEFFNISEKVNINKKSNWDGKKRWLSFLIQIFGLKLDQVIQKSVSIT